MDFQNQDKPKDEKDFLKITEDIKNLIKIGGNFSHKKVSEGRSKRFF